MDQADHHVECGRLARAVRAQQSDDLAAVDVEADAVDDAAAGVGLGDAFGLQLAHLLLLSAAFLGSALSPAFFGSPSFFCCSSSGKIVPLTRGTSLPLSTMTLSSTMK